MPRSSGGGSRSGGYSSSSSSGSRSSYSSGGGSHSDGYSSSSSSSSSSYSRGKYASSAGYPSRPKPRVSDAPFEGASRYVYYKKNEPHYIYSNTTPKVVKKHYLRLAFYLILVIGMLAVGFGGGSVSKLTASYDPSIIISDGLGCLGDTSELKASLNSFYEETGIVPAVMTGYSEYWQPYSDGITGLAYDLYVNSFTDEGHWLIVYTESQTPDPAFNDWYWEGMQGDETVSILTDKTTDQFGENLQKYLTARTQYTVAQALTQAFNDLTPVVLTQAYDKVGSSIMCTLVALLFLFLGLFRSGILVNKSDRAIAVPQPVTLCNSEEKEYSCEYCGAIYHSSLVKCPHCGAPRSAK